MKRDQVTGFALLFALLISLNVSAADWPNWLGPNRDGTTTAKGFDPAFAKGGVDILYGATIGVGFTGVTVADGIAYTAGWEERRHDLLRLRCQDRRQGLVAHLPH